ncbi:hypothetical protein B0H21DRAFT_884184 [Amylocystis lapponica]|nr:hypothetical protein B0H21DRAFT_884184 [Amylocystis lapponica]
MRSSNLAQVATPHLDAQLSADADSDRLQHVHGATAENSCHPESHWQWQLGFASTLSSTHRSRPANLPAGDIIGRISRQVLCNPQRLLSVASLQRTKPSALRKDFGGLPPYSRNYWWSSSAPKSPVVTQEPIPPQLPEQPPAETATLIESTNALDSAPTTGTEVDALLPQSLPDLSVIPPLNYGDLAALGLAGWSPAGFCRWGMELLQVSTGIPWFWTIIGATVLSRLVLFPFTVKSMRNTAALAPYQDEINGLREEMTKAQASRDRLALQTVAMKQQMIYQRAGVSVGAMALVPFLQLPVTLGMFFGVKSLCDFPLEQLKNSGLDILPDLTLTLGVADMTAAPHMVHIVNGFRLLSIVGVVFMINLPSGVMVYLITSIAASAVQTLALRQPAIRRALKIPVVPRQNQARAASFRESYHYLKKWWQDKQEEQAAIIKARRNMK